MATPNPARRTRKPRSTDTGARAAAPNPRRQRVMRSLTAFMLSKRRNWSDTIDPHFHDQAHFVRDFRAFMTMSPREYAALEHPILTAFMPERERIWGSPAQTLDRPAR